MTTGLTKPEWDTPPNGDFASYVERLTAPRLAIPVPSSSGPSAKIPVKPSSSAVSKTSALEARLPSGGLHHVPPPPFGGLRLQPFLRVLRTARVLLLALTAIHGAALVLWGRGSVVGLLMMAGLWWWLGWFLNMVVTVLNAPEASAGITGKVNQGRLRQMGLQRQSGKKKQ